MGWLFKCYTAGDGCSCLCPEALGESEEWVGSLSAIQLVYSGCSYLYPGALGESEVWVGSQGGDGLEDYVHPNWSMFGCFGSNCVSSGSSSIDCVSMSS